MQKLEKRKRIAFHIFFPYPNSRALRYGYNKEIKAVIDTVKSGEPVEKHECPALILNRFKKIDGTVLNRYDHLDRTTGYYGLDIDGVGPVNLLKRRLFDYVPELLLVWVSSSGKGIKAIGFDSRLQNLSPEDFRKVYKKITYELRIKCGMRINFDQAMGRCHQPIFLNVDRAALSRVR